MSASLLALVRRGSIEPVTDKVFLEARSALRMPTRRLPCRGAGV
jgi:hypothetical protein